MKVTRTCGLVMVPPPAWVCPAKRFVVTLAEATGANSARVVASVVPALGCTKYTFTATPLNAPRGTPAITSPLLPAPVHAFAGLAAGRSYRISAACVTASGARVPTAFTAVLSIPAAKWVGLGAGQGGGRRLGLARPAGEACDLKAAAGRRH